MVAVVMTVMVIVVVMVSGGLFRGRTFRRQHGGHGQNAWDRLDGRLGLEAQGFHAGAALGIDLDGENDAAIRHMQAGHHVQRDDVAALFVVDHRLQGFQNRPFRDLRHA